MSTNTCKTVSGEKDETRVFNRRSGPQPGSQQGCSQRCSAVPGCKCRSLRTPNTALGRSGQHVSDDTGLPSTAAVKSALGQQPLRPDQLHGLLHGRVLLASGTHLPRVSAHSPLSHYSIVFGVENAGVHEPAIAQPSGQSTNQCHSSPTYNGETHGEIRNEAPHQGQGCRRPWSRRRAGRRSSANQLASRIVHIDWK